MNGELIPNTENSSNQLLTAFKELFALIQVEGTQNILESNERVTRLIFERLMKQGSIDKSVTYERWIAETFSNNEPLEPTYLIQLARENNLIDQITESNLLKERLIEMLNSYLNRTKFNLNQELVRAVREALSDQQTLTKVQYDELAERLILKTYST